MAILMRKEFLFFPITDELISKICVFLLGWWFVAVEGEQGWVPNSHLDCSEHENNMTITFRPGFGKCSPPRKLTENCAFGVVQTLN